MNLDINRVIMAIFAIGAIIGGIDYLIGNKWGYGEKFEEAINLMPPTVFHMVGILCLTPAIGYALKLCVTPAVRLIGIDPGMLGGVLALDMGGYPLAMELADNPEVGSFSGILVGCIFGCTLVFAIPFGMGVLGKEAQKDYLIGVIIGLIAMPGGLLAGGLVQGLSIRTLLYQMIPVLFLSFILIMGLLRIPEKMISFFQKLSKDLNILISFGLVVAAVCYLLAIETPYLYPITDGMLVVVNITLALLGSLPFAKLLQVVLKRPLKAVGRKLHIQESACVAMLIGLVSAVPVYTMMDGMDSKSRIVVSTFLIDGMAILGAHLAYTAANAPEMTAAMLVCKLSASLVGLVIAFLFGRTKEKKHGD